MKAWKRIVSAIMVSTAITATPFAKKLEIIKATVPPTLE